MTALLTEGQTAPDFSILTDTGKQVSLSDFAGKFMVLYFYPKDDTKGCTVQALDFSASISAFAERGAAVLGVSRDPVARHAKFRDKYNLRIPLGADENGKVTTDYGVWVQKQLYGREYMGIERSTYLIGPDKQIRKIWRKVKPRGHVEDILSALDGLGLP
jgi:thioredoxin-dependent peroxiredoxin